MNNGYYFLIPILTAFTGWLSAWILFKLCFHPRKPRRILGFSIHGLLPKLKENLPFHLSVLSGQGISSVSSFKEKLSDPENLKPILPLIENHIDDFLRNKLPVDIPMVAMFVGDKTIGLLKQSFLRELQTLFPEVIQEYAVGIENQVDLKGLVEKKIQTIADQFEEKLKKDLRKQVIFISLITAIAGLVLGLLFLGLLAIL